MTTGVKLFCTVCLLVICLLLDKDAPYVDPAPEYTESYYTYIVNNDGTVTITDFDGFKLKGELTVPETLGGLPVTGIGDEAFEFCWGITQVDLPASITFMGKNPFQCCGSLVEVNVAEGSGYLESRDGVLFSIPDCRLITYPYARADEEYTVPEGTVVIGEDAFYGCKNLKRVTLPEGVTELRDYAFDGCDNLECVTLPESLNCVGSNPFTQCRRLTDISIAPDNTYLELKEGSLFTSDGRLVNCIMGKVGTRYTVPTGTLEIGDAAFYNCSQLISVTLPEGLTSIGEYAFDDCWQLEEINFPNSLESIGDWAFEVCQSLSSITLPESLTYIGDRVFCGCLGITSVNLPASLTHVGANPFEDCYKLETITVDESSTYLEIKDGVLFSVPDHRLITYPYTREGTAYAVPEGTLTLGGYSMANACDLVSVTLPEGLTTLEAGAFYDCNGLEELNIPDSVTYIGDDAFSGCMALTKLELPRGLKHIGSNAFYNCDNLVVWVYENSYASYYIKKYYGAEE